MISLPPSHRSGGPPSSEPPPHEAGRAAHRGWDLAADRPRSCDGAAVLPQCVTLRVVFTAVSSGSDLRSAQTFLGPDVTFCRSPPPTTIRNWARRRRPEYGQLNESYLALTEP